MAEAAPPRGCAARRNLALARQEDEHVARRLGDRTHRLRRLRFEVAARRRGRVAAAEVAGVTGRRALGNKRGQSPSSADRSVVACRPSSPTSGSAAGRRAASSAAAREGKAEVGVDRALVKLVEDDGADAAERRIAQQPARQHALGHDEHARILADATVAHAVARARQRSPRELPCCGRSCGTRRAQSEDC